MVELQLREAPQHVGPRSPSWHGGPRGRSHMAKPSMSRSAAARNKGWCGKSKTPDPGTRYSDHTTYTWPIFVYYIFQ